MNILQNIGAARIVTIAMLVVSVAAIAYAVTQPKEPDSSELVFVVHGLGRTKHSMGIMRRHLRKEGYRTVSFGYDSRKLSIEEAATKLRAAVSNELKQADAPENIHFVTHSLGGILVRKVLADYHPPQIGRVVMISPPNHGSEIPDRLGGLKIFKKALGPAGLELGTGTNSVPNRLPPPDFELGVITGDRSLNPLFSGYIAGKDDGKVSVESAKLKGMRDFLIVHSSHTWIMNRKEVREQTVYFLRHGLFKQSHKPLAGNSTEDTAALLQPGHRTNPDRPKL